MTKTYQLTGPTDEGSRERLVTELHEVPGVYAVDIVTEPAAEESLSVALSGSDFTDEQVEDAAVTAGYGLTS